MPAPLSPEHRNELYSLSPPISIDYYATHSDDYRRDRDYILKIDDFIRRREGYEGLTVNERSYELFGDEKAIAAPDDGGAAGEGAGKDERGSLSSHLTNRCFAIKVDLFYRPPADGGSWQLS